MEKCKTCEYKKICEMPDFVRNDLKLCKTYTPKIKKTNADRIRNMSDEELAEFLVGLNEHCLAGIGKVDCSSCNGYCEDNCKRMTTNWLQSEVKGSE